MNNKTEKDSLKNGQPKDTSNARPEEEESLVTKELQTPFEVEEKSTTDLEEWIEEQGIQLRY
ncbi:MAG: hypothetical protein ACI39H_01040 [Lachnospiraceae bacterium]